MSKNVKIGNNTLTGVTTIKLEDADTSGTYDSFVDITESYDDVLYSIRGGDGTSGKTTFVVSSGTYYPSNVNYNNSTFFNRIILVSCPPLPLQNTSIANPVSFSDIIVLNENETITGEMVFAKLYYMYSEYVEPPTTINVTVGCNSTGPYIKINTSSVNLPKASEYARVPFFIKYNNNYYVMCFENGGSLRYKSKSPISQSTTGTNFSTNYFYMQQTGSMAIMVNKKFVEQMKLDGYNSYYSPYIAAINTVYNANGEWRGLMPIWLWKNSNSGSAYFTFNYGAPIPYPYFSGLATYVKI